MAEQVVMQGVEVLLPEPPDDPAEALIRWAADVLVVPPGHPAAGAPMVLPDYLQAFIRETFTVREAVLTLARKNAKTAGIAALVLAYLAGPLRIMGWRAAAVSINKEKGYELVRQCKEIAAASRLSGLRFLRSPAPGRVETGHGATLDVLAADAAAGAASGYDLVVVDELGLLQERDRALLSGLKSSLSARRGRFIGISIVGDGPFIHEYLDRADDPAVAVHAYMPTPGSDPCDPATWAAGNPGLGTIKDRTYMVDRARAVAGNPSDMAFFAAEDCNLPGRGGVELVCTVGDWTAICDGDPPPRRGRCCIGFDAGGSSSLTAAAIIWESGRLEVYAGAPVAPDFDLRDRGRHDAVGSRYEALHAAGELWTYEGRRTTPAAAFLGDVREAIGPDAKVAAFGADRYRQSEVVDYMAEAAVKWPTVWRGVGAGKVADGSADLRAFQRGVLDGWIRPARGLALMVAAIEQSEVRRDPAGNPALSKTRQRARIDALQAAVIAAGLALPMRGRRPRRRLRHAIAG